VSAAIDSLKLYDRLRAKLPDEEARVIADALSEIVENDLATKRDLKSEGLSEAAIHEIIPAHPVPRTTNGGPTPSPVG
jgi:hypothetical protein